MPFEAGAAQPKKIAVIGAGISGMGAAHMLADAHHVTLFENENRLGGHARTIMAGKRGDQPVDTGFIVFNHVNYPHLTALFERLDVPVAESNMTFGVSIDGGRLEYGLFPGGGLDHLFAQRINALRPGFWRMIRDILRFSTEALETVTPEMTIGELLDQLSTGPWFRDYFLLPFSGAIWSTPTQQILDFPAQALVRFFDNHALLDHRRRHQWYTVQGGSVQYVSRIEAEMRRQGVDIRLGTPVQGVRRVAGGVEIRAWGGEWERFDEVIMATHSDDSLSLLTDADLAEKRSLGAIKYQPNEAILHADTSLMPKRRKAWASWVYTEDKDTKSDVIDLTYWMNSLQPVPMDDLHFVTLNTKRQIREELIYDQTTFRHPVYDLGALAAQKQIARMNGKNHTWFCGAWMKNGFHEDGLSSAVDVVEALRRQDALKVAAE